MRDQGGGVLEPATRGTRRGRVIGSPTTQMDHASGSREDGYALPEQHVTIANEDYFLGADGLLMPVKNSQVPPDLKYFKYSQD
jgi:hypothetical protein